MTGDSSPSDAAPMRRRGRHSAPDGAAPATTASPADDSPIDPATPGSAAEAAEADEPGTRAEPSAKLSQDSGPRHSAGARRVSRRTAIRALAGLGVVGVGTAGYLAARNGTIPLPAALSQHVVDQGPAGVIPDVPPGTEKVEPLYSSSRGQNIDFYTAIPDGHGDGAGLPVCLVLHGASATAADFPGFGFGRFLTDAVRRGVAPFVLAGATGTRGWEPGGGDDAQQMVRQEMPGWCADRGFDITRMVVWGWSLGGYGALRLAEDVPGFVRAVAAFSPAVQRGDSVFRNVDALRGTAIGLWCGESDGFYGEVRALQDALPEPAAIAAYDLGAHTRKYWNRVTPAAFDFIAARLA